MNDNNIQILGEGSYTDVFMPPIKCDIDIPLNSVGKIGDYEVLKREYEFIFEYIKHSPSFSELVNKNNTMLCKIDYDRVPENMKKQLMTKDNPEYELIMPYLGKTFDNYIDVYENICKDRSVSVSEIITVGTFIKYIKAINVLFNEVIRLNDNNIYHNDIKPNNIIYNEDANTLLLIDFNLSIIKNIPSYYYTNIKVNQKYRDLYYIVKLVLLNVILIGLSNKYIYDNFIEIYKEIKTYLLTVIIPMDRFVVKITPKIIDTAKNKFIEFMENIMQIIDRMDEAYPTEINENKKYCKIENDIKIPFETQRKYASVWDKNVKSRALETALMGSEDIKPNELHSGKDTKNTGGTKRRRYKKNKTQKSNRKGKQKHKKQ
jgi:serine/threonine protein kinase